jgi:2-furoyl-CoA dehydrogenase FAD binding subunit
MKPAAFDYLAPETAEEAIAALTEHGDDARVMAGGQSLMPILNMRLARPGLVVDIAGIAALDAIDLRAGAIEIGACTTQAALMRWPGLVDASPLLAAALPHIGHFQTRNRGTVCGSLCHADPSSELPLCLAVLGGEVVLRNARRQRIVAAAEFQTGMLSTAKAADEIAVAARYPVAREGAGHAFHEITRRRGDFAIVALAAVVHGNNVRLGVGGVADRPMVRDWDGLDGDALDDALNAFAWELGGTDDIHATGRYRREMVRTLGRRVIEEARQACRS